MQTSAKQRAEGHAIGVSDACGDFVDAGFSRLQQMDRSLDPHALKVIQRGLPENGGTSTRPNEVAVDEGPQAGLRSWTSDRPTVSLL